MTVTTYADTVAYFDSIGSRYTVHTVSDHYAYVIPAGGGDFVTVAIPPRLMYGCVSKGDSVFLTASKDEISSVICPGY